LLTQPDLARRRSRSHHRDTIIAKTQRGRDAVHQIKSTTDRMASPATSAILSGKVESFDARSVVGVDNAPEQADEGLAFGFGQYLEELGLGAKRDVVEPSQLGLPGWGERDALAAAVVWVAVAVDEPASFDLVEVADEVAAVDGEAVGEFVLGEWSEVRQCGEYGEVGQPQVVFRERLDQQAVANAGDCAGEVGRQAEQGWGADLVVHAA
jgi:hypothetical protein